MAAIGEYLGVDFLAKLVEGLIEQGLGSRQTDGGENKTLYGLEFSRVGGALGAASSEVAGLNHGHLKQ